MLNTRLFFEAITIELILYALLSDFASNAILNTIYPRAVQYRYTLSYIFRKTHEETIRIYDCKVALSCSAQKDAKLETAHENQS